MKKNYWGKKGNLVIGPIGNGMEYVNGFSIDKRIQPPIIVVVCHFYSILFCFVYSVGLK